jgi:dTDP-D-glucose 4,6-dehydratase
MYNISSGYPIRFGNVIRIIIDELEYDGDIIFTQKNRKPIAQALNLDKLKSMGWISPSPIEFESNLRKTIKWQLGCAI